MLVYLLLIILAGFPVVTSDGEQNVPGSLKVLGEILQYDNKVNSKVISETTEDFTLYVTTTGSDSNGCRSSADACLTIQEAVNRVPTKIVHDVTIDIAAGNFSGFTVAGFTVPRGHLFTIRGTLGDFGTGNSGTADGGTTTTCVDSGQGWAPDELRGALALVNGEYRVIRENDVTSFEVVGPFAATCNGKAYAVEEQKTVINADSALTGWRIHTTNNRCSRDSIVISDLKTTGGTAGISIWIGDGYTWLRLNCSTAAYGGHIQAMTGTAIIEDCYFASNSYAGMVAVEFSGQLRMYRVYAYANDDMGYFLAGSGAFPSTNKDIYADGTTGVTYGAFNILGVKELFLNHLEMDGNAGPGLTIRNVPVADVSNFDIVSSGKNGIVVVGSSVLLDTGTITDSGVYGLEVDADINSPTDMQRGNSVVRMMGNITISNSADSGIFAKNGSMLFLENTDGANLGAYGLELENGATTTITSATGITGATDDATIDEGITPLTWAGDFAQDGDIVVNQSNGCRIERSD